MALSGIWSSFISVWERKFSEWVNALFTDESPSLESFTVQLDVLPDNLIWAPFPTKDWTSWSFKIASNLGCCWMVCLIQLSFFLCSFIWPYPSHHLKWLIWFRVNQIKSHCITEENMVFSPLSEIHTVPSRMMNGTVSVISFLRLKWRNHFSFLKYCLDCWYLDFIPVWVEKLLCW